MRKLIVLALALGFITPIAAFACHDDAVEDAAGYQCGGISHIQLLPRISFDSMQLSAEKVGSETVVHFLGSKFAYGGVLIGRESSDFALDDYSRPADGRTDLGYDYDFQSGEIATYHSVKVNVPSGWYYVRPYFTGNESPEGQSPSYGMVLGREVRVFIP